MVAGVGREMTATDASDFDSEASPAPTGGIRRRGGEDFAHDLRFGDVDRRSAQRTGLVSGDPGVDTVGVERVATDREKAESILRLELREADGAISGSGGDAGERRECEQRERIDVIQSLLRRNSVLASVELSMESVTGAGDLVGGGAAEVSEKQENGDGDYNYGDEDDEGD